LLPRAFMATTGRMFVVVGRRQYRQRIETDAHHVTTRRRGPIGRWTRTAPRCGRSKLLNHEQPPIIRDALKAMRSAIAELQAGACNQVLDRTRNKHLARLSEVGHAATDMHRDPCYVVSYQLAFSGMQANANLQSQCPDSLAYCTGTADRPSWSIERASKPSANVLTSRPRKALSSFRTIEYQLPSSSRHRESPICDV
jgi:hypothetical protein